ncbi:acyl-CoA dehydrogenase family protein [Streptomyces profundus]|uniref:acyl-CoA dehydrogenase family protein n=1 Tax=Streptomyces profundus TaxID=2867410 RepID=UPI001D166F2E|nr:acyl-CoA dehydrogenase family protein [Streptomyces sp. MA3_2.13]UED82971.1 acyl-CoA dehydrogenase family protein [Streptomyces sp. MA3_2.13]
MTDQLTAVDRATARRFVDEHIAPHAGAWDRAGRVPDEVLARIAESGLWAPFLPPELGGSATDLVTLGAVHEEFGRACSSVRSLLTVHTMVAWALRRWGTAEQRERWGRELGTGRALGAFCLSEPEAGSDTAAIATTARAERGGWVLDGVKTWITGGQRADLFLVFARGPAATVALLVPRDTPGVRVTPIDDMLGTRASMLARIDFREVRLGPDALLGPAGFASGMLLTGTLDLGRYSVAAGSVGIVQACLDASADHCARRVVGGVPLRDLPLIRAKVSDMVTDARAARLLVAEAGRLKDAGDEATLAATWVAKYFASTAAARHATEAVQIHGAAGCAGDHPVSRYYRDAKVMEIIEGSSEIQRLTIADEAYRRRGA